MNIVFITTMQTFAVRKEEGYPYFEVVELKPRSTEDHWKTICGYRVFRHAAEAAEAMERWEMFNEQLLITHQGVPAEDLPPHRPSQQPVWLSDR